MISGRVVGGLAFRVCTGFLNYELNLWIVLRLQSCLGTGICDHAKEANVLICRR
jgi:hypothetical protein